MDAPSQRRTRWTTDTFSQHATSLWEGRWDYSEVQYLRSKDAVSIICQVHGTFKQSPKNHLLKKIGCVPCSNLHISSVKRGSLEGFLKMAEERWGSRWDYSHTEYTKSSSAVRVVCKVHGEFEQRASNHLLGYVGCTGCLTQWGERVSLDKFKGISALKWGGLYDYSNTHFTPGTSTVTITCPHHGDFTQSKYLHMLGDQGCTKCSGRVYDLESLRRVGSEVWEGKYTYEESIYVNTKTDVLIKCRDHGYFHQKPETHIQLKIGCKSCQVVGTSKGEQALLEFVKLSGAQLTHRAGGLLSNPRIELDIYVPEKKVAIEFNGVYWHSSKFKDKEAHHTKFKMAEEAEIKLVQVWEDDWNLRRPIVEEHLKQVLGVSTLPKIAARKTKVVEVPYSVAKDFLNANHIQGAAGAAFHLSLQYEGDVVALASFKRRSDGDLELVRYATSANVQGGHSKLVTYVERNYTYSQLVTFADLTFGSGELYRQTGWIEDKFLSPDYQYLVGGRRVHKFNYRLKKFREDPELQYVEGMSESQLAELNGLLRVYDAGKIRFVKKHPNDDTI